MNLYDMPSLTLPEELVTILAKGENIRIERILSTGQVSDWYDQSESEFFALLQGAATIEYGSDETKMLTAGDTLLILPHQRHRVTFTSTTPPCVWLCIFWR